MPSWEDLFGPDDAPAAAPAADAGDGVTWSGLLPTTPLRDLVGAGFRVQLRYDWFSQLATWSLFNPMSFESGVDAYAAAVVKASGGSLAAVARTYVGGDDDLAWVDFTTTTATPANVSVRGLLDQVDRGAYACQVVSVSRVPSMTTAERAKSLEQEKANANARNGANGGGGGSSLPSVVGVPKPQPGFWDQFGKYTGIVVGLAGALVILYVAHNTVE